MARVHLQTVDDMSNSAKARRGTAPFPRLPGPSPPTHAHTIDAQMLYRALSSSATGPGPLYLYKPLLHLVRAAHQLKHVLRLAPITRSPC